MSGTRGTILVVDDDGTWGGLVASGLGRRGFTASWVAAADEALSRLQSDAAVEVLLTDVQMPGLSGPELCRRAVASRPDLAVVVMTAFGSLETAIEALRAGAYDFVSKPVELDALALTLERAVQHRRLTAEVKRLRQVVAEHAPSPLLGDSPALQRLKELVHRVADSEANVLISGESGTGKEVLARFIHSTSRRREGPFIAVNCAAMPEALLESELFGHVKGAFTDARSNRVGLFAQAAGGTLLLDEVGELPLALQPKLLRALQERTIRPVGGDKEHPFDARLIAATNRDLESAVEEGTFREDLFFRLNVLSFELPPLRLRGNDILTLAQDFLASAARRSGKTVTGFSRGAAARLLGWTWPGNVRELQNCVERAVAFARFEEVQEDDLPDKVKQWTAPAHTEGSDAGELGTLADVERRHIERVLQAARGNRTLAARILGVDRKTLWRKLGPQAGAEGDDAKAPGGRPPTGR